MHRRTARGNRLGLGVTGLVLVLAGAALIAAHRGMLDATTRDQLYPAAARRFVHENTSWLWPVVAAVAIALGLVFLRWLLVQARIDRLRRVDIDADEPVTDGTAAGRTHVVAHAVTDVVEDDICALPGVRRAAAVLSGHSDAPSMWLTVSTDADADLARIRHAITTDVLDDARACLDLPDLVTYLRLEVTRRSGAGSGR